jgi:hypothetical protein
MGENSWIFVIILIVILVLALYYYSNNKSYFVDNFDNIKGISGSPPSSANVQPASPSTQPNYATTSATPPFTTSDTTPSSSGQFKNPPTITNPSDLLPKDINQDWASNIGAGIMTPDLLQAGYHIGIDSIGQTLKNPCLDLRSQPCIPKQNVSPWNISTIEPDKARVPFEIGYGPTC